MKEQIILLGEEMRAAISSKNIVKLNLMNSVTTIKVKVAMKTVANRCLVH